MVSNKKRGEEIQKGILRILNSYENPVSTSKISEEIERPWHSVDRHCIKLQVKGKIHGFKAGVMNLWQVKK